MTNGPEGRTVPGDPFERLDDRQVRLLREFEALLLEFNRRINLISREDEEHVFRHHITHCLFLTHRRFPAGATVVDWGTGGGLPAVPLAVAMPDVRFVAVDAISKKVRAVQAISRRLGLDNLEVRQSRAEAFRAEASYSVSRATAPLERLWAWHARLEAPDTRSECGQGGPESRGPELDCWRPGLICLKGGDLTAEIAAVRSEAAVETLPLSDLSPDPYFREKVILACTRPAEHPPTTNR